MSKSSPTWGLAALLVAMQMLVFGGASAEEQVVPMNSYSLEGVWQCEGVATVKRNLKVVADAEITFRGNSFTYEGTSELVRDSDGTYQHIEDSDSTAEGTFVFRNNVFAPNIESWSTSGLLGLLVGSPPKDISTEVVFVGPNEFRVGDDDERFSAECVR